MAKTDPETSASEHTSENEDFEQAQIEAGGSKMTLEQRQQKLAQLRSRMVRQNNILCLSVYLTHGLQRSSAKANRASLVEESTKAKVSVRDAARLDRQRKLAEIMRQKADAEEHGEDVERQKNWEWTIEENDEWEKKQARKARRADFEFHSPFACTSRPFPRRLTFTSADDSDAVRRKYRKDLDHLKPDLEAYNRQKEIALGLAAGTLTKTGEGSSAVVPTSQEQQLAAENLYRNANTLIYGDNKPSEDAIDKVVSKINQECVHPHTYAPLCANFP